MDKKQKAAAMRCFGSLVLTVEESPDSTTQDSLQEVNDCKNCESHQYCSKLADTLS